MSQIIDGKEISKQIKEELASKVKTCMIKPSLAVIQIGEDPASNAYIKGKAKAANEIGMNFRLFQYAFDTSEREIVNKIVELNNDEYIDGIIVQLPLPSGMSTKKIINAIDVSKDVDGLTDKSIARFYNNRKCFVPCTPQAVMELLKRKEIEVAGKHVVVVGRSNLVGKPLVQLFLKKDATVTVCHSKTENLKELTKLADVLIVAVGKKHLITADMVKEGVIIIDVGITREDGKLYGDVDFDKVEKKASYITPVPGGVGPMTVTMLLRNVIECYNNKNTSK
ncbi:MAG: bifunctional methylenetetrahydrofolate dehydrogenase/methenyltetrahydrofolate cyclohydrolase [Bacilli bacterium]|jgi:methylenetetrahydrofolate dehydrogenase (NADP+)/methenyltetrahydrofolate cyclohydrolase|nr:bifunctional methylenetetrahydrofolate dehydrogenase/methenyltetrahydrofolate cyclohydrolase [Bacilli bacterium]